MMCKYKVYITELYKPLKEFHLLYNFWFSVHQVESNGVKFIPSEDKQYIFLQSILKWLYWKH